MDPNKSAPLCKEFLGDWGKKGVCRAITSPLRSGEVRDTSCTVQDQKDFADYHPVEGSVQRDQGPKYHIFTGNEPPEEVARLEKCRCPWVTMQSGERRR
jgi:hypothetical protein